MYFPIGAPSVYSQDLPNIRRDANHVVQDGLDEKKKNEARNELIPGLNEDTGPSTPSAAPGTPRSQNNSPSVNGSRRDGTMQAHRSRPTSSLGLAGMQSARSGQLFATITSDSITIWQAKVGVEGVDWLIDLFLTGHSQQSYSPPSRDHAVLSKHMATILPS